MDSFRHLSKGTSSRTTISSLNRLFRTVSQKTKYDAVELVSNTGKMSLMHWRKSRKCLVVFSKNYVCFHMCNENYGNFSDIPNKDHSK